MYFRKMRGRMMRRYSPASMEPRRASAVFQSWAWYWPMSGAVLFMLFFVMCPRLLGQGMMNLWQFVNGLWSGVRVPAGIPPPGG